MTRSGRDAEAAGTAQARSAAVFASDLERTYVAPETLTLVQLRSLLELLGRLVGERDAKDVTLREVQRLLRDQGLATLTIETVADLLDAVAPVAHHDDVLAHLTLRRLELLLDEVQL